MKKRIISLILVLSMLSFGFSVPIPATAIKDDFLIPGEIVVDFSVVPEIIENGESYIVAGITCSNVKMSNHTGSLPLTMLLVLPEGANSQSDTEEAIRILEEHPQVIAADQNFLVKLDSFNDDVDDNTVYDPSATEQWYLDKIGVAHGWYSGVFTGSNDVTIAILDTGIASHNDLENNIDIQNACNTYSPDSDATDTNGHGTFIAGIIGADLDGQGMNGICQEVNILPIKITRTNIDFADQFSICDAIDYAISQNVDIINLSFASYYWTERVIDKIDEFDGIFVTTAGNGNNLLENDLMNSLKVNKSDNWIIVGASDINDEKAEFSNHSEQYVDLFAPGVNIYSTTKDGGYAYDDGTSFAAPMVAATCAVIMANASYLTAQQVISLVLNTVDIVPALEDYCVTGGRLSFYNAMNALFDIQRPTYSKGDVNGDGYVTTADYTLCRSIAMNNHQPSQQEFDAADINEDGSVTTSDYLFVRRHVEKSYFIVI